MSKKTIFLIFASIFLLPNLFSQCQSPISGNVTINSACTGNIVVTGQTSTLTINAPITGDITIDNQQVDLIIGTGGSVSGSVIVNGQQADLFINGPIQGDLDLNNQQIIVNLAANINGVLDIGDRQATINVTEDVTIGSVRTGNQLDGFTVDNGDNSQSITLTILNDVCVEDQQSFFHTSTDDIINILGTIKCTGNGCNQASFMGNVNASACMQDFGTFCASLDLNIGPLPIELLSFSLTNSVESVMIDWATASEINNRYFTIQKSFDGTHFFDIVTLPGAGNSNEIIYYQYLDKNPTDGLSYYRLRQTDFDGTSKTFKALPIRFSKELRTIKIYPNPTQKQFTLDGEKNELENITIYNLLGQDVTQYTIINSLNEQSKRVDVSLLEPGLYMVKTKNSSNRLYKK